MTIIVLCPKSWAEAPFLTGVASGCSPVGNPATQSTEPDPWPSRLVAFRSHPAPLVTRKRPALCEPLNLQKQFVSAAVSNDRCLDRHHQLFRIGRIRLRYPDLLLKVIDHIFPQPDLRRLLGDGHLVDFVLQPKQ